MSKKWYVIRTKPQSEYVAADALETNGLEFFLPLVRVPDQKSGTRRTPLFPGYVFLRCHVDDGEWPSLNQLSGISGWVRFGDEIPSLPDALITGLKQEVDAIDQNGGLWNRFQVGQIVRVALNSIESIATVIEEPHSPEANVRVLLEFMGREVQAQVPWHSLQSIAEEKVTENYKRPRRTRGRGRWIKEARTPAFTGA